MNVVENIRYNVPLPLFCLLIILSGCNFREVLDDYPVSGVQITLDWTGVAENLPETVRVIFYPKDAEGRKVDGYLPAAGGEMKVPPGHYAMIVYNYSTECVCIEGDECYGTIRAYTERCIGMDAGEDMIWSPDDFYVVALDDVEIAKSEAAMVMKLKPERVVSSYSFAVKVDGVENISAVVCYVSGLNGGYFLGRRLCTLAEVPVYVENDCKNGLLQGHFSHFRLPKSADTRVDSPVVLTINFGCPVKRVAGKGAGAGMLQNIPKMLEITRAVADAVKIPVTVKTRLGWDAGSKIIVDLAEQLQDCGIAALTIHGRTRAQMYTGEADWTLIGEVKNNPRMHIPIIGNGDVTTPQRAKECFDRYGVDAVMIGRASFGRPWIFKEVKHYLETGEEIPPLSSEWKLNVLRQEVEDSVKLLDERRGILHVRRHLAASPLFKGIPNFRETRIAMLRAETKEELYRIFNEIEKLI